MATSKLPFCYFFFYWVLVTSKTKKNTNRLVHGTDIISIITLNDYTRKDGCRIDRLRALKAVNITAERRNSQNKTLCLARQRGISINNFNRLQFFAFIGFSLKYRPRIQDIIYNMFSLSESLLCH